MLSNGVDNTVALACGPLVAADRALSPEPDDVRHDLCDVTGGRDGDAWTRGAAQLDVQGWVHMGVRLENRKSNAKARREANQARSHVAGAGAVDDLDGAGVACAGGRRQPARERPRPTKPLKSCSSSKPVTFSQAWRTRRSCDLKSLGPRQSSAA